MFHTILALSYIIPNIYVFIRVYRLFISKKYRLAYIIFYLLLAAIYPLSGLLPQENPGVIVGMLKSVSDYLLPFYLYLFLSVLFIDILLLINIIFGIISLEKLKDIRLRKAGLAVVILISMLTVIGGIINFNTISISDYSIEIPARASGLNHLKIALASDFHLKEKTNINFVEEFVKKVGEIAPDIMIFGGDIVEGDRDDGDLEQSESLLKKIKTKYGVYAVLGNHEYYSEQDKGSFFDKAGMEVLCDTFLVIDSSFNLGGRYDSHFRGRKPINALMRSVVDSLPVIVADHRPIEIEQAVNAGVDILLSGHTHNGQLFPINLITRKIYKLSWGHLKEGNTHVFVTSGIRLWGPPVRTIGKSEIMVIDIRLIPAQ
jgi:predicted MPP superfamily phosphohydrolase